MNKYLVLFDNCVTDDLLVEVIYADNADECWEKAYKISAERTGYSEGNFDIFEEERPKGQWIKHDPSAKEWYCSCCNYELDTKDGSYPIVYEYCNSCGADMRGGKYNDIYRSM